MDEKHRLDIHGSRQWIFVRGAPDKPLVLFVHGGPGVPLTPLAREFETPFLDDFLVVHWDQRGAGKSFENTDFSDGFTLGQFVDDGLAVTRQILAKYGRSRAILVGHSWGTVLSTLMVAASPGLFTSCILVGTCADTGAIENFRYQEMSTRLKNDGAGADLQALADIGPPPWDADRTSTWIDILERNVPWDWVWGPIDRSRLESAVTRAVQAGDYSDEELESAFLKGQPASWDALSEENFGFDATRDAPELKVPVFFVQGSLDFNSPSRLARHYYERLVAPEGKHWLELEGHGHMVFYEAPDDFLRVLKQASVSARSV